MLRAALLALAAALAAALTVAGFHGTSAAFTDSQTFHIEVSSGGLAIQRDGAGLIFSPSALAPGDPATASVKVTNDGTLPYDLALTREMLGSTAPGGCAVRDALTLKIVEVTAGGTRRTLADGALAGVPTRIALGTFAAGEARTYEVAVTFVAKHGATATDNDNCFQGSADRERFGWNAAEKAV